MKDKNVFIRSLRSSRSVIIQFIKWNLLFLLKAILLSFGSNFDFFSLLHSDQHKIFLFTSGLVVFPG